MPLFLALKNIFYLDGAGQNLDRAMLLDLELDQPHPPADFAKGRIDP